MNVGTFRLGGLRVSGRVIAGDVTQLDVSPVSSDNLSESFGGDVTSLEIETISEDSFAQSSAGDVVTLNFDVFSDEVDISTIADANATLLDLSGVESTRFLSDWAVFPGPNVVEETIEEVRERDTLTIVWRVSKSDLKDYLRPALQQTGKVDVVDRIDGGYDALDRADGSNQIKLRSQTGREDIRPIQTYYVNDFDEEPQGTEAESWEVEVELVPEKEKHHTNEFGSLSSPPSYSDDPEQWLFEFETGDILTSKVTTDVSRTSDNARLKGELTIILLPEEVRVLEENSGRIGSVNYREVPDGEDLYEDTTSDDLNTVTISPPDTAEDTIATGDYIITETFETTWNQGFYEVEFPIVKL